MSELIGKKFEMLTIEKVRSRNRFREAYCRCDCGNKKWIRASHICGIGKSGQIKSCGCLLHSKKINPGDHIGNTYGFLKPLSLETDGGNLWFDCECLACGKKSHRVRAGDIKGVGKSGGQISCGCKRGYHNKSRRLKDSHDLFIKRLHDHKWELLAFSLQPGHKHLVQCPNRHPIDYTTYGFKEGSESKAGPKCIHCNVEETFLEAQKLVKEKSGRLLSPIDEFYKKSASKHHYTGSGKVVRWECSDKHPFKMQTKEVRDGHWCPQCWASLSERKCRAAFAQIFNTDFPSTCPEWLRVAGKEFLIGGQNSTQMVL